MEEGEGFGKGALQKAQEAFQELEKKYLVLAENMNDGILVIQDSRIKFANARAVQITGYTREELTSPSRVLGTSIHPDDWEAALERTGRKGREDVPLIHTLRVIDKQGSMKWVEANSVLFEWEGRPASLVFFKDMTERRRAEEELRRSNEQLRALSARLQTVREEERTLVAREIHDELGQSLTALKMDIAWLARKMPKGPNSWVQRAKSMAQLVDTTIDIVRKISAQLRPGLLDDLGLKAAMEWQLQEFQARTGIKCRFTSNREEFSLNREHRTAAFRIFQETLTNVARHANTSRVEVGLNDQDGFLILEVRDHGKGITKRKVSSPQSLGILGMRERALLLGGEFQIRGIPGKGTTVTVKIPFRRKQATKKNLKTKGRDHD